MNSDIFEGKWKQFVGAAKTRWAKLTDDDWTYVAGKKDQLIGRIQERYGITREEAQKEADEFARQAAIETDRERAAAAGKY
ncbi:MAG: CsbD family protein [Bryobacteraceae bacterium]